MNNQPGPGLLEVLQQIPDPRGREGLRHPMTAMLAAVICATLCGHQGLRQTVRWLKTHGVEMWHLLGFRRKPPVRQSFANLLKLVDEEVLEKVLLNLVSQLECQPSNMADKPPAAKKTRTGSEAATASSVDAEVWDGKTLRGTRDGERRAEQVLVRMQAILGTIIGSIQVPSDTNESKAPFVKTMSSLTKGKLIIGDAAYCHRDICESIVDSGGDYLVTVKKNQPQLLRDIEQSFVIPQSFSPLRS